MGLDGCRCTVTDGATQRARAAQPAPAAQPLQLVPSQDTNKQQPLVFRLHELAFMNLPSSYQRRPISPPPRTWAMAKVMPRSTRERREDRQSGSFGIS